MSEIARLRAQIERECESIRLAMYGFAAVASHAVIERKYNALGEHQEELEKLVGKDDCARRRTGPERRPAAVAPER